MRTLEARYYRYKGSGAGESEKKTLRLEKNETGRDNDTKGDWQRGKSSATPVTLDFFLEQ